MSWTPQGFLMSLKQAARDMFVMGKKDNWFRSQDARDFSNPNLQTLIVIYGLFKDCVYKSCSMGLVTAAQDMDKLYKVKSVGHLSPTQSWGTWQWALGTDVLAFHL